MSDEGATPRELVFEACRRNNTDLLLEVVSSTKPTHPKQSREDAVAELLNTARDGMGNAPLHIAAGAGAYEVLDIILDQPGVETDPLTRTTGETPLHLAVSYLNSLNSAPPRTAITAFPTSSSHSNGPPIPPPPPPQSMPNGHNDEPDGNNALAEILLDAGCDPRIRNRSNMKPVDCVARGNQRLQDLLRRAEIMIVEGEGIVNEDEGSEGGDGPPSDSD